MLLEDVAAFPGVPIARAATRVGRSKVAETVVPVVNRGGRLLVDVTAAVDWAVAPAAAPVAAEAPAAPPVVTRPGAVRPRARSAAAGGLPWIEVITRPMARARVWTCNWIGPSFGRAVFGCSKNRPKRESTSTRPSGCVATMIASMRVPAATDVRPGGGLLTTADGCATACAMGGGGGGGGMTVDMTSRFPSSFLDDELYHKLIGDFLNVLRSFRIRVAGEQGDLITNRFLDPWIAPDDAQKRR